MCVCVCVCVCFVAGRYSLKAVRSLNWKQREKKKQKMIPFRENLLGSIRPFPGLIQFFMLGAINPTGSPLKQGRITIGVTSKWAEPGTVQFWFLIANQTGFAEGELINDSAVIRILSRERFSVHSRRRKATLLSIISLWNEPPFTAKYTLNCKSEVTIPYSVFTASRMWQQ